MDTATTTTNGVSATPTIALDDEAVAQDLNAPATPGDGKQNGPPKPAEAKSDPDDLVLELGKRSREAIEAKKAATTRERELAGYVAKHKGLEAVLGLAKSDPAAFIERIAEAAGLDVDTAMQVFADRRSGGKGELTADQRVARLEAELARRDAEAAENGKKTEADRKAAEGDAAIKRHVEAIKSLAKAGDFPEFNDDPDVNGSAAFDLMVLAVEAGKPISYAAALDQIEKTLQAETDRRATRRGYAKANGESQPTTKQQPTTAAPAQPRQTHASAAPVVPTATIKSDEEIAADWANSFARRQ